MCKLRGIARSPAKAEEALEGHHRHDTLRKETKRPATINFLPIAPILTPPNPTLKIEQKTPTRDSE